MNDIFLSHITINAVRQIKDLDISLSKKTRTHLFLAGKNGSGKTAVLLALFESLQQDSTLKKPHPAISFEWNSEERWQTARQQQNVLIALYGAKHHCLAEGLESTAIACLEAHKDLLEKILQDLFQDRTLTVHIDASTADLVLLRDNADSCAFQFLSDGYAAALRLLVNLLLRSTALPGTIETTQGIVLLDNIETFLDIDLQKRILPVLIATFPGIQFIIGTHSRQVMASIEDGVVFDLDRRHRIDNRLTYPYEALLEQYDLSQHSDQIKQMLDEYEHLLNKQIKSGDEEFRVLELGGYLAWLIHKFQKTHPH